MNRFIRLSSYIYSGILVLYPVDLRRDFGDEMTDVFAQDLAEMWHSRRLIGALSVWRRALWEVTSIAVPAQIVNSAVIAPTISFFWVLCALAVWPSQGASIIWPSLGAALISLTAVSSCRRTSHHQALPINFIRE
jgi:hypothetical protein